MNEYNAGDLVEAVKGETVIRGPLVNICGLGRSLCLKLTLGIETDLIHLEANGFTITVIEKAAPVVVLPTEPGVYEGSNFPIADAYVPYGLDADGQWFEFGEDGHRLLDEMHEAGTLTRLEPVSETAKKVLDRVLSYWDFEPPANIFIALSRIAKDFGVEL